MPRHKGLPPLGLRVRKTGPATDPDIIARERAWLKTAYERCHPEDTFSALEHRATFVHEDRFLLQDWKRLAARAIAAEGAVVPKVD